MGINDCEGSQAWREIISNMCLRAASELRTTFSYLGKVPWLLSPADDVEAAQEIRRQIQARPLHEHDPVTQDFVHAVGNDLESRANGEDASTALVNEARSFRWCNLDETCGEGYHRGTSHEKSRAPSATTIHLKQKVRAKSVIKTCRWFIRTRGAAGNAVVRFEWLNYGRVVQTSLKHRYRPKRMKVRDLMRRVYREDDMAKESWSSIMTRIPEGRPVDVDTGNAEVQLQNEYLNTVLVPNANFGLYKTVNRANEDGTTTEVRQREYFTVINTMGTKHRLKMMHTFASADDVAQNAPFAMEVQLFERWESPEGGGGGDGGDVVRVYAQSDPEWVLPSRLGAFHEFAKSLFRFHTSEADPGSPAVLVWSGVKRALPPMPLTDPKCPTLALVGALHQKGWDSHKGIVRHTELLAVGKRAPYDGRESPKQKFYYQALLSLPRCLPLSGGCIPSQEPQAFYRLLLRGDRVVAGLGNKHYVQVWNSKRGLDKKDILAIEDVGPALPPLPNDGEMCFAEPLGPPEPPEKKTGGCARRQCKWRRARPRPGTWRWRAGADRVPAGAGRGWRRRGRRRGRRRWHPAPGGTTCRSRAGGRFLCTAPRRGETSAQHVE